MNMNKDEIVFEALRKVLHHEDYAYIGEAFQMCTDDLQGIYPSLTKLQQATIEGYVHCLADVYTAALTICLEEKDSLL